ncbi:MAG: DUF229 domain-containing protein [Gemmataceae bacterium]|nr:DUF229 domain-containing protein [Gemmataceae bacterium]
MGCLGSLLLFQAPLFPAAVPPNVLWIIVDDMSPNFGCYGEKSIQTPHVDRLARDGTRFDNAFITAPVCSPCRSALITGMYQTTLGSHHHRSGRGSLRIKLPQGVDPIPVLFQKAGFHTCIGNGVVGNTVLGKTDYNFDWNKDMYDSADWSNRKPGQPFFMQVQLQGGKLRDGNGWKNLKLHFGETCTRPETVTMPPYYPRDPDLLKDWAYYLDAVRQTDHQVGAVLARLEKEHLLDQTLVVFMTDHGISHARGKQFLYDEGTRVPLVLRGPGITKGTVRTDLVEHIDLAAFSLAYAGIGAPTAIQGKNILSPVHPPKEAVFAARDRCDETVERLRSVRTKEWLLIENGYPDRPALQPNRYKDHKPTLLKLRELRDKKALSALSIELLFAPTRSRWELYHRSDDPFQTKNVAFDATNRVTLERLKGMLAKWQVETGDMGRGPEPAAMYDSDMKEYLDTSPGPAKREIQTNIDLMKRFAAEGK